MGGGGEGKDGRMRGVGRGVGGQCAKCAAVRHTAPQCATVRQTAFAAPPLKLPVPKKREKPPKISQRHRLVASRSAARILVASRLLAAPPAICLQSRGFAALRLLAAPPRLAAFAAPVKFGAHLPEPCTYA